MRLHRALQKVHQTTDQAVAREVGVRRSADGLRVSCRPGCAACCRQTVTVPIVEAVAIFDHLRASLSEDELLTMMRACADQAQALADPAMTAERWFAEGHACPVLSEDRLCRAYATRPTACRTHVAFSPAANCATPGAEVWIMKARDLRMATFQSELCIAAETGMPTPLVPLQYALLIAWFIDRDAAPGWLSLRHTTAMQSVEGTAAWAHLEGNQSPEDLAALQARFNGELPRPYPIWDHLPLR